MKGKITSLLIGLIISGYMVAQPPQAFKYQAVVRDAAGEILQNQTVGIQISILDGTPGGTTVYKETFSGSTNQFGLINIDIGMGTPVIGTFNNIDWSSNSKFIKVEIDPDGGSNYVSMGTTQLLSVPYALYAEDDGDWIKNGNSIYADNSGNVGIGISNPNYKLEVSSPAGTAIRGSSPDSHSVIGTTDGSGVAGVLGRGNASDSWGVYGYCPDGGTAIRGYSNGGWAGFFNGDTHIAGNLGVGVLNPTNRLEVSGSVLIKGSLFKSIKLRTDGTMVDIESPYTALALNYQTGNNTVMNVVSGNVGVGTSTPDAKLHVNNRIRIGEDPTYPNVYGELIHEGSNTGFRLNANSGGTWAYMLFQTDGNTRMAIKSNGRVGIGTTSPISRLEVLSEGNEMALYAGSQTGTGINASSGSGYALFAVSQAWAGWFSGNVYVSGSLSKGSGSFVIDHPLDPVNKLLRHNFVESPENLLIYRGKVELNENGEAQVDMPDYFKALTKEDDASIHLTPVGKPFLTGAEWNNDFSAVIVYGEPNRSVYWEVLADRDDPVIHKLARPVEEEKGGKNSLCEKGKLLYPEAYGFPENMGQDYEMKQIKNNKKH